MHDEAFHGRSFKSDMPDRPFSRVSGRAATDLAIERLRRPDGAARDGALTVDALRVPFSGRSRVARSSGKSPERLTTHTPRSPAAAAAARGEGLPDAAA